MKSIKPATRLTKKIGISLKHRSAAVLFATAPELGLKSSAIEAIRYEKNKHELTVQFKQGGIYRYDGVDPETFWSLLDSDSAGRNFVSEIRNQFPFDRLDRGELR
jgi:hypothetical protein